jgi:two-component system NarL family response regulator
MTNLAPHRPTILILHHDPLLSAGVAAALRPLHEFRVLEITSGMEPPVADIVIADHRRALLIAEESASLPRGPLAAARILVLTSTDREVDIRRAIEVGVHGYLLTGGPLSELVNAVTALANGGRFLCQPVAQRVAYGMSCAALTRRENDVLRLVVAGEANKTIARRLGIELGTVKSHMTTIMSKLGAESRVRVASIATERGLLGDEEQPTGQSMVMHASMAYAASAAF